MKDKMDIKKIIKTNMKQILFVFTAFLLMVVTSCFFVSGIIERQTASNAREILAVAEEKVTAQLREAEITLFNVSVSLQYRLDSRQTNELIQEYLRHLTGWLLMPENRISGLLDIFGYIDGSFIDGGRQQYPHGLAPEESPWYTAAMEAHGRVVFTKPYSDAVTGNMIITASKMLSGSNGETYGAIALNLDLSSLSSYIELIQFTDGGYGMLLDSDLVIVTHPSDEFIGRTISSLSLGHAGIAESIRTGETEITEKRLIGFMNVTVVAFFRAMKNGMFIGIAAPLWGYYKDMYLMALTLSALGLVFMSVLSCFLIRMSLAKMKSEEENRSKSSFLARMSHEIRTPMNSILGMSELIMRDEISDDVREHISIIHQSCDSLLAIINDILDFSKIESGQLECESKKYFFSSMINDMINVMRMRISEKALDFLVNVDPEIPQQLVGDQVRIRQIVINLLANAAKYTEKGFVSLDVRKGLAVGSKIEIIFNVRDSGIGIKREDMDKIFVDFTRLDVDYNRRVEGTGLGLAIARTYCRLMGGDVSVESEYNQGSIFTATVIQAFEEDKKLAEVGYPGQKRVLLFDERPRHIQSIVSEMRALGVTPTCSLNLAEFIEDLEEGEFDFAFVSSRYAVECVGVLDRRRMPLHLVVMVEMGDASAFRDIWSVMMPIYSVPIANALNGVIDVCGGSSRILPSRFIIPDARILIVDDILSNLRVAKELVAQYKANIDTCKSGADAIELVRNNRYDMVFMDHMMPEMDGIQATAAIRGLGGGNEYFRGLPIVALTANAISGQKDIFLQNGMDDFLAKPIETQHLDQILRKWINEEKQIEVKEGEPAEAPPVPAAKGDEAPKIPGVNVSLGIKQIGGSVAVYRDILSDFCADANEITEKIKDDLRDCNFDLYAIHVHAMKGASKSIGATEFSEFAARMEEAGKNRDIDMMRERTGSLLENLDTLVRGIYDSVLAEGRDDPADANGADNEEKAGEERSDDILRLELDALKSALINLDIETVNGMLLGYVTMKLDSETRSAVSDIERHILMFEYEKAVEFIDEMLLKKRGADGDV
ncbi:MAG: response regulator [Synergistaceae bacterium]|jgi:signal transduction histidine kinase/CheY-like chemotaxis protein/HPt (histidine-containing phosphotransfer) domain-containing protein|nr:response regulator [Synergistaceae bacterium]